MKVGIDNWRWEGVPFFLRTGKRLPERVTEIVIQFKHPLLNLFSTVECNGDLCDLVESQPNQLVLRIQPRESIFLKFSTKRPGMQYHVEPVVMDFDYEDHFSADLPGAYERLLLDVMRSDSTLFTRSDELLAAWKFVTPILQAWEGSSTSPDLYNAGTWGPPAADRLVSETNRRWREPRVNEEAAERIDQPRRSQIYAYERLIQFESFRVVFAKTDVATTRNYSSCNSA